MFRESCNEWHRRMHYLQTPLHWMADCQSLQGSPITLQASAITPPGSAIMKQKWSHAKLRPEWRLDPERQFPKGSMSNLIIRNWLMLCIIITTRHKPALEPTLTRFTISLHHNTNSVPLCYCSPGLKKVPTSPWLVTLLHICGVISTPQSMETQLRCHWKLHASVDIAASTRCCCAERWCLCIECRYHCIEWRLSVSWCFTMFYKCFMMFYYV